MALLFRAMLARKLARKQQRVFLNKYFKLQRMRRTCGKSKEEDDINEQKAQDVAEDHLRGSKETKAFRDLIARGGVAGNVGGEPFGS